MVESISNAHPIVGKVLMCWYQIWSIARVWTLRHTKTSNSGLTANQHHCNSTDLTRFLL